MKRENYILMNELRVNKSNLIIKIFYVQVVRHLTIVDCDWTWN